MGVGGIGVPGSGWSHLGFWSLLTASWMWPKSRYPEPPSPSPFEVWPKAAAGQVLGPAVMSEGPSSPKGESSAFSRVGFPGSREASSHPCGRLQEREMTSTEGGAPSMPGVSRACPRLLTPHLPPLCLPSVATFISEARGQCWFPTVSQSAAHNGRLLSPGREAGPPPPEGPGPAGRCGPAAGASGGAFGQEGERRKVRFWEGAETQAAPCGCAIFTWTVLCSGPVLRALEPLSTLGTGEPLPAPVLENCPRNSYRWFSEISCPSGDLSPSFLRQPVFLLHSVLVRRLNGIPVWPAPKVPISNLKVLCSQPFPCGSCRPLRFGLSSPLPSFSHNREAGAARPMASLSAPSASSRLTCSSRPRQPCAAWRPLPPPHRGTHFPWLAHPLSPPNIPHALQTSLTPSAISAPVKAPQFPSHISLPSSLFSPQGCLSHSSQYPQHLGLLLGAPGTNMHLLNGYLLVCNQMLSRTISSLGAKASPMDS